MKLHSNIDLCHHYFSMRTSWCWSYLHSKDHLLWELNLHLPKHASFEFLSWSKTCNNQPYLQRVLHIHWLLLTSNNYKVICANYEYMAFSIRISHRIFALGGMSQSHPLTNIKSLNRIGKHGSVYIIVHRAVSLETILGTPLQHAWFRPGTCMQGSVVGPILFSVFFNYLPDVGQCLTVSQRWLVDISSLPVLRIGSESGSCIPTVGRLWSATECLKVLKRLDPRTSTFPFSFLQRKKVQSMRPLMSGNQLIERNETFKWLLSLVTPVHFLSLTVMYHQFSFNMVWGAHHCYFIWSIHWIRFKTRFDTIILFNWLSIAIIAKNRNR